MPDRAVVSERTGASSHFLFWGIALLRNLVPAALFATLLYFITGGAGLTSFFWVVIVSATSLLVTLTLGLTILAREVECAPSGLTVIRGNSSVETWPWEATFVTPEIRSWAAIPAGVWILRAERPGVPPSVASIGISQWRVVRAYLDAHSEIATAPRPGPSTS